MSVRFARFDKSFKQVEESVVDAQGLRVLPDRRRGDGGGHHHRVPQSQRRRDSRQLRRAARQRQMDHAASRVQRQLEDRGVPGERPVAQRERQRRRDVLVHRRRTIRARPTPRSRRMPARRSRAPIRDRRWRHARARGSGVAAATVRRWPPGSSSPNQRAQFRARRIERNGTRSAPVTIAGIAGSRSSGYPRAAVANGEVVFAWTESADGGGLQVRTAPRACRQARK